MRRAIIRAISTVFYIGYLPLIPGTFGSLAGIIIFYLLKGNALTLILAACVLMVLGFIVSGAAERQEQKKDASCIVIDEVSGMLLSLLFLPYDIRLVVLAFLIFRILDTLKPFPAGKLQRMKGSLGVMSDDIVAGVYANIVLQVIARGSSAIIS